MTEALARHNRKEAVVVPIILRPCHWTGLPFGQLQAATKDGKPVEKYLSYARFLQCPDVVSMLDVFVVRYDNCHQHESKI
jgi:hypothetical protein